MVQNALGVKQSERDLGVPRDENIRPSKTFCTTPEDIHDIIERTHKVHWIEAYKDSLTKPLRKGYQ